MRQWFIRTFRKKVAVKINVLHTDGRMTSEWCIPKMVETEKVVKTGTMAFILKDKNFYMQDRVPVFFFNTKNVEPLEIDPNKKFSSMDPVRFEKFKKSKIMTEIITAGNVEDLQKIALVLGIVIVGVIALLGYYLTDQINAINESLKSLGA